DGTITPKIEREEARDLRLPANRPVRRQHQCAICTDTAQVSVEHQWTEDDDPEEQGNSLAVVEHLGEQIQNLFGQLRPKSERVIDDRVHPDIRAVLADALREHANVALGLADRLNPPPPADSDQ